MSRSRFWALVGVGLLSVVGVIVFQREHLFPRAIADYTAGNFTNSANGTTYGFDGVGNVLMGSFLLPNPVNDTLLINGAGNAVADKNTLTAFSGSNFMFDADNDSALDPNEAIISSISTALDSADTVLTAGTNALSSFITSETPDSYYMYFDQGATSSSYDTGEDVYRQIFNNVACTSPDGTTSIRLPETTWAFIDLDSDSLIDQESSTSYGINGETFFRDADADGFPSAGDSIIIGQGSGIKFFAAGDKVCFDGSVVNDGEYDSNEVIWFDVAGNCASFTSTTDSILVGGSAPTGGSTLASNDNELGYLDNDNGNSYTCARAGTCETPVYSGLNATSVGGGDFISASAVFFDSSNEGTDGIRTTGIGWDEVGGAEKIRNVASIIDAGSPYYLYTDCNASNTFSGSEDLYVQVVAGATAAIANGVTARTFDSNERVLMTPGTPITSFTVSNGVIIKSSDADLSVGALDGSGTDQALSASASGLLDAIPATNKYFDHDATGAFVAADDVVVDVDASGYYNADDIMTLAVTAAASGDTIDDTYLTAIRIYQRVGNNCVGAGTDVLLGTDSSAPFLNQPITLTKAPYATSDATGVRTLCVYADVANNSVHGKIWTLTIPAAGAVFSSNSNSPTTEFTAVTGPVQFVTPLAVNMTTTSTKVGVTATYTFTYTIVEDAIANNRGLMRAVFPSGFSVSSASASCTDDGVPVSITSGVSGQSVQAVNASGSSITVGSVIVCTVGGVRNPSTAGTSAVFEIGTYQSSTSRMLSVDVDNTVLLRGGSSSSPTTVSNTITMTTPNGGESLTGGTTQEIWWSTTGTGISYVHLSYSTDNGSTWNSIATNEGNDGVYSWTVPQISSSSVLVKVEGTDLVTIVDDDTSDAVFTITSTSSSTTTTTTEEPSSETTEETEEAGEEGAEEEVVIDEEEVPLSSTLTGGMFVKRSDASTVYAIDENLIRHPFMDLQTYLTYQDSFDAIVTVDEDTFNQSTLGTPMPVNVGRILVKFDSESVVYTVNTDLEGKTYLKPIPDEDTVSAVFGEAWSESVIALRDSAYGYYDRAEEQETVESLTAWVADASVTDRWHLTYADPTYDPDGDGAATWMEASWGTDPYDEDTDSDGYNDKTEYDAGYSPLGTDTDGDGYTDVDELRSGNDPFTAWIQTVEW